MKIIDILATQEDSVDDCIYSKQVLPNSSAEKFEEWPDFDDSEDEQDELNLSFREGLKRTASDEFCSDLKRIKFDNNVRDLTNNLCSFKLKIRRDQGLEGNIMATPKQMKPNEITREQYAS